MLTSLFKGSQAEGLSLPPSLARSGKLTPPWKALSQQVHSSVAEGTNRNFYPQHLQLKGLGWAVMRQALPPPPPFTWQEAVGPPSGLSRGPAPAPSCPACGQLAVAMAPMLPSFYLGSHSSSTSSAFPFYYIFYSFIVISLYNLFLS